MQIKYTIKEDLIMSIASEVISTNTKLTNIRNALRELLTHHGIVYYNDDDVFTLARRVWFLILTMLAGGSAKAKLSDAVQDILNPPAIEQTYNK